MQAILLIDHGSKVDAANELLGQLKAVLADDNKYPIIEVAHMELARPTLGEAFDACVAQGATRIVIVPYFLAPGAHASQDIPQMAVEAAAAHPAVEWTVAAPLGFDVKLVDLVDERAREAALKKWE